MDPFKTFCEQYASRFIYGGKKPRALGVEKEILITDEEGWMGDVIEQIWPDLIKEGYELFNGHVYKDEIAGFHTKNGTVTTDAGQGTLEIILDPYETVQACDAKMTPILKQLLRIANNNEARMIGIGYQPRTLESPKNWSKKRRYEAIEQIFGEAVLPSTLGAADQVHIDIRRDEFTPITNLMQGVAGFMMVLFSNSPLRHGKKSDPQMMREMFWDDMGKITPGKTGVPERPWESMEDYLNAMWDTTCILSKEEDEWGIPNKPFREFVEGLSDEKIFEAFCVHEGSIWFCSRPRVFGTMEVRPACIQPWKERMTLPAFSMGLIENWKEGEAFIKDFEWKELPELRQRSVREGFQIELHGKPISAFLEDLLKIVQKGLESRGQNEGQYLEPLFERVHDQKSPADRALEWFDKGGIPLVLDNVSLKNEDLQL